MRRGWMAGVALVLLWGVVAAAAPKIGVDQGSYDFGSAMEGTFVRHVFVLRNDGDETLRIGRVRSTCGCTTSALPTNELAPGETVPLEVVFDTAGYGGRTVTKSLSIESNDPNNPTIWVRLTGRVTTLGPNQMAQSDLQYLLTMLIDLRSPEAYARGHILGAVNIPFERLGEYILSLPKGLFIVVYDEDGTLADQVVPVLIQNGYRDVKSLYGGYAMWVDTLGTKLVWPPQE